MRTAGNSSQVFEDAPKYTIKIVQADTINGFVRKTLWGCTDFMDADMPPLTKGRSLFLRFAYAPIPKQFERTPIGTLF